MIVNVALVIVGFVLAAIAFYNDKQNRMYKNKLTNCAKIYSSALRAYDKLVELDYLSLSYIDGLEDYAEQVTLLNVDLHDTLIEQANENRMLRQQTSPMLPVKEEKPPTPAKRATRTKKGSEA